MPTPKRTGALLLGALLILTLAACGAVGPRPAATIEGTNISDHALRGEVANIQSNDHYRGALEQAFGAQLDGAGKGTLDSAFVAQVLSLRIYYTLLQQELDHQGQPVSSQDLHTAASVVEQQFASLGADVLKSFPPEYRQQLTHDEALITVAGHVLQDQLGSAREYYDAHRDDYIQACVSHILVGLKGRSKAEAKAKADGIKAELDGGADFARLAKSSSDDEQNKDQGGDLGCGPRGQFVPAFDHAVFSAPIGVVTGPVETEFGFHLILVRSRHMQPFSEVEADVQRTISSKGSTGLETFLAKVTCNPDADVHINSRYGRWDRSECTTGGFARVVPPEAPTTTSGG